MLSYSGARRLSTQYTQFKIAHGAPLERSESDGSVHVEHDAEAEVRAAYRRRVREAVGGAGVGRVEEPLSPAAHPLLPFTFGTHRVHFRRAGVEPPVVPVFAPLLHVPVTVVQTPRVGREGAH